MSSPVNDKDRFTIVGQPLPKIDAWAKVTGETRYADDLVLPRMAFGKLLRSPHAHALIKQHRHRPGPRAARRVRRHHRPRPAPGEVRHPARLPGRGGAVHGEGAHGRRCGGRGGGRGRGDGGRGLPAHRGRVPAAAGTDVDPGVAGPPRGPHPRVRRRPQRPQERGPAVRGRRGGLRRLPPGPRGRLLLRGQHAPADGAARRRRPPRPRRQADAVVVDRRRPTTCTGC